MGHTMKHLKWYHLQGQTYCTQCDPTDPSRCLENACPQRYNTGEWYDGKCRCPIESAPIYAQSGGPYVVYTGCAGNQKENIWSTERGKYMGRNWNCKSNSFQIDLPGSKCKSCQWYAAFYCTGCVTKGAVVKYEQPGSRMYCVCPKGFVYKIVGDKCVRG